MGLFVVSSILTDSWLIESADFLPISAVTLGWDHNSVEVVDCEDDGSLLLLLLKSSLSFCAFSSCMLSSLSLASFKDLLTAVTLPPTINVAAANPPTTPGDIFSCCNKVRNFSISKTGNDSPPPVTVAYRCCCFGIAALNSANLSFSFCVTCSSRRRSSSYLDAALASSSALFLAWTSALALTAAASFSACLLASASACFLASDSAFFVATSNRKRSSSSEIAFNRFSSCAIDDSLLNLSSSISPCLIVNLSRLFLKLLV